MQVDREPGIWAGKSGQETLLNPASCTEMNRTSRLLRSVTVNVQFSNAHPDHLDHLDTPISEKQLNKNHGRVAHMHMLKKQQQVGEYGPSAKSTPDPGQGNMQ